VLKRLDTQWLGPRMNFNFCLCPLCKVWMNFQKGSAIQIIVDQFQVLADDVRHKSFERLKYENKDKDPRISNPQDSYYQKPQEYALAIYCYYQCFKCKKPYFGGAKDCQRALVTTKTNS
jgi:E3 ubiquitin-protein ligase MYCBP2